MCIYESFVWVARGPNVVQQPKPCGDCWQCRENRINDYVGRAMCEAATSAKTCFITMTYAERDDLAHKIVTPRHFQLFMKMLRRAGHKVRYLVAGEYGELKGRAHFHALLFFEHVQPLQYRDKRGRLITRGQSPRYVDDYLPGTLPKDWGPFCDEIKSGALRHIREWPHGHVQVQWTATPRNARYVCKYLYAEDKNNAWFSLSKKPALGAEWFARKAAQARELGVMPSSFEYLPPGGGKKPCLMTGATRRDYLAAIGLTDQDRPRMSEWVQRTYDKYAKTRRIEELEAAETLRLRTEGFKLPEPEQPEPAPEGRTAWCYSDRRAEEAAAEVDPNHKWEYPFCDWTPLVGAGYGTSPRKGRPEFFSKDRIYNPKPRAAPRSVCGSGNLRRREGPPRSGGRNSAGCGVWPGAYPEYFQGSSVGRAGTAPDEAPAHAEAEGAAGWGARAAEYAGS